MVTVGMEAYVLKCLLLRDDVTRVSLCPRPKCPLRNSKEPQNMREPCDMIAMRSPVCVCVCVCIYVCVNTFFSHKIFSVPTHPAVPPRPCGVLTK